MTRSELPDSASPKYFDLIAIAFVTTLLVSNIAAQKLFALGPFTLTAGILAFPLSYIFGDVLTEVYGYARSRRAIWAGFVSNVFMVVMLLMAVNLPPASGWPLQQQFEAVLGFVPRIVLASVFAYWTGEFANSFVLAKMKIWTSGKHLWSRTIGSTIVGQAVDTVVFVAVAFAGVLPWGVIASTAVSGYIFKVAYEILATPLTYLVVGWLKKAEGIDVFDRNTDFNPFRL